MNLKIVKKIRKNIKISKRHQRTMKNKKKGFKLSFI